MPGLIICLFSAIIVLLALFVFLWLNDFRIYYLDLSKIFPPFRGLGKVIQYYNRWTDNYLEVYGDVIQGHRPVDSRELLDYIIKSAGLKDGDKILDAGGGVGGPAIHFAKNLNVKIEMVTVSEKQYNIALSKVKEAGTKGKINVTCGDYHQLDKLFPPGYFDVILFLESYGHSFNQKKALTAASGVLKRGGTLYIKDYFKNFIPDGMEQKYLNRIGIRNMNKVYCYNAPDLYHTIYVLKQLYFELVQIKKPAFGNWDEFKTILAFQEKHKIDLLEGKQDKMKQHYVLPYELIFQKSGPLH